MSDNKQGKTQFCTQCEAKGKENANLLQRCEEAEKEVERLAAGLDGMLECATDYCNCEGYDAMSHLHMQALPQKGQSE